MSGLLEITGVGKHKRKRLTNDSRPSPPDQTLSEDVQKVPWSTYPRESKAGAKRLFRNHSEKMRRIRMNNYLMELACLVPSVINSHKKLDKTSILRLTVNFLRFHSEVTALAKRNKTTRPDLVAFDKINGLLMPHFGGFLLILDNSGTILYSSDTITHHLGINVVDILGKPVHCIIHPEDEAVVLNYLLSTSAQEDVITQGEFRTAKLRVLNQRKGQAQYGTMSISGRLCSIPFLDHSGNSNDGCPKQVFICIVSPEQMSIEQNRLKPMEMSTTQYISHHDLEGGFMDADFRAAIILGYFRNELSGLSAYDFICREDIPFAADAHIKVLQSNGTVIPETLLRLKVKDGRIIYSQTHSHLVVNTWTKKPRYLISVNTIVSESDGEQRLEEQRKRLKDPNVTGISTYKIADDVKEDILGATMGYSNDIQDDDDAVIELHSRPHFGLPPLSDCSSSNDSLSFNDFNMLNVPQSSCLQNSFVIPDETSSLVGSFDSEDAALSPFHLTPSPNGSTCSEQPFESGPEQIFKNKPAEPDSMIPLPLTAETWTVSLADLPSIISAHNSQETAEPPAMSGDNRGAIVEAEMHTTTLPTELQLDFTRINSAGLERPLLYHLLTCGTEVSLSDP